VFCDDAGPIVRRKYEAHAREKRRACVREEGAYARTRNKHASGACGRAVSAGLARVRGGEQTTGALARKRREGRVSSMGLVAPLCNERAGVQQARRRESRRGLYGQAAARLGQTVRAGLTSECGLVPKLRGGYAPQNRFLPRRGNLRCKEGSEIYSGKAFVLGSSALVLSRALNGRDEGIPMLCRGICRNRR